MCGTFARVGGTGVLAVACLTCRGKLVGAGTVRVAPICREPSKPPNRTAANAARPAASPAPALAGRRDAAGYAPSGCCTAWAAKARPRFGLGGMAFKLIRGMLDCSSAPFLNEKSAAPPISGARALSYGPDTAMPAKSEDTPGMSRCRFPPGAAEKKRVADFPESGAGHSRVPQGMTRKQMQKSLNLP